MSSVWKRLQRVGKNASKFQFTASYESLTVECAKDGKWQPNKLSVVWTRRKRRKCSKLHTWNPGISNPFRGVIVWAEPEEIDITVTLYKDSRPGSPYEDKEWTFTVEDESTTGRRKPIAHGTINMVDYASMEFTTKDVSLKLKLSSKKLVYASLDLQLSCVLIREGKATDEDMISIGSMLSLNEIGSVRDFDIEPQIATPQPVRSHKRSLSGGNSLPRAKSFTKKDLPAITDDDESMAPVQLKRTRSKSTTPANDKYNVSNMRDTYIVDRRLSSASQVSMESDDTDTWDVIKDMGKAEGDLIQWCRNCTHGYKGVKIKNTTTSWRDGMAFCAILHHFHPNLIDFTSLDPENIKENNKLAFDGFEKVGINRLLDPTTMAITSVPDKLSMITYLFQIKTHFTKPETPASHRKHKAFKLFRKHGSSSGSHKGKTKEPKLDIVNIRESIENINESPESPTDKKNYDLSRTVADESYRKRSTGSSHVIVGDDVTGNSDSAFKKDNEIATTENDDEARRKSGFNPFDDEEEQDENEVEISIVEENEDKPKSALSIEVDAKSNKTESSITPSKAYNPFDDDDEDSPQSPTNRLAEIISETKEGYNPFDSESDTPNSPTETKTNAQPTVNATTSEERAGYNPFDDDDDDLEVGETPAGSGKSSDPPRGYNPFDDDEDGQESEQNTQIPAQPEKPALRRTRLTASGRKIKLPAPKPRGAPYRPNQDSKPNALPRKTTTSPPRQNAEPTSLAKRKLPPNPKPRPSRPAPRPPGRVTQSTVTPNNIPTFDEWKKANAAQGHTRDQSPASRTSLSPSGLVINTRSVSPSGRTFQSRRPAPKPPGKLPENAQEDEKTGENKENVKTEKIEKAEERGGSEKTQEKSTISDQVDSDVTPVKTEDKKDENMGNKLEGSKEKISEKDETQAKHKIELKENEKTDEIETVKNENERKNNEQAKDSNVDIKVLARQVLMEARKKAGASSSLPRDRVAVSPTQSTTDLTDGTEGSSTESPQISDKEQQEDKDGSRRQSFGPKPAKPPKPSSLREKLKAETERQSRLTTKSRENLEVRKKRDTEVSESKQRQSISKANSLISHSQQRDRKKESSNESLSTEPKEEIVSEKKETETKLERKSSHVMEHRPLKFKFQKEKDQGSSESVEKPEKYEESDNIKRLRAVLNEGKDSKDSEESGTESEKAVSKTSPDESESPPPTPPRRTSLSYQQRRRNRLSSSGSDSSNKSTNLSDKKRDASKPKDIPNKPPQGSSEEGVVGSPSPSKKGYLSRAAAAQKYAESRKMKFDDFELPVTSPPTQPPPKPPRTMVYEGENENGDVDNETNENEKRKEDDFVDDVQNPVEDELERSLESGDSSDLQDTAEYVQQELQALAAEQEALDKVAAKLEKELRDAMKRKGCEEEEEKLMQSWFILVNKKNELVRRQTELNILEKEDDLERRCEMLNRELRGLMCKEEWEKTDDDKAREASLLEELVVLVNKRDRLVQLEDTQVQQMERDERHIQQVIRSAQVSRDKSECVLQ